MRYYQMYSHLLPSAAPPPASTIAGVTESERCPSVQSSATQVEGFGDTFEDMYTDNAPGSALPSSGKAPSSGQNPASRPFL